MFHLVNEIINFFSFVSLLTVFFFFKLGDIFYSLNLPVKYYKNLTTSTICGSPRLGSSRNTNNTALRRNELEVGTISEFKRYILFIWGFEGRLAQENDLLQLL